MSDVVEISNLESFLETIHGDRVVVDFAKRHGCVPCARLDPHYKAAAASPKTEGITFVKVLLDEASGDLFDYVIKQVGVMSTPTVIEYRHGQAYQDLDGRTAPVLVKELSE